MIRIESKVSIKKYIIPHLSTPKRGGTKLKLWEIVNAILYKLKTGVQWHLLPIKSLIYRGTIKWGTIYHYYRKWVKDGSWEKVLNEIISSHKHLLDMSICHFDGTHTPCKKGGEKVAFQGRKRCKTTNTLFLSDNTGLTVAFSEPISGEHHDTFEGDLHLDDMEKSLQKSDISMKGLFINADAAFDNHSFRTACEKKEIILNTPLNRRNSTSLPEEYVHFDELMYQQRFVIERTNAWMDNERNLLIRQDTSSNSWKNWIILFIIKLWLKRIKNQSKL